ncbi:hypothetical protein Purlil1_3649 [Purpureocillium lilacinum]|uniref:Uncharacterized protein n=1 Tax=Purpureocillium lilacinum TaxID=33203 RepID=A0ABR0C6L9_PURLI|nr:hypothetical protein Purlil1_3649 [Purpureocillium lilacinum]
MHGMASVASCSAARPPASPRAETGLSSTCLVLPWTTSLLFLHSVPDMLGLTISAEAAIRPDPGTVVSTRPPVATCLARLSRDINAVPRLTDAMLPQLSQRRAQVCTAPEATDRPSYRLRQAQAHTPDVAGGSLHRNPTPPAAPRRPRASPASLLAAGAAPDRPVPSGNPEY